MQVGLHKPASRLACALAICLAMMPTPAAAQAADSQSPSSQSQSVGVTITQPTPSITSEGVLRVSVDVSLAAPAEYFEVRLRMKQPSGKLVYQKTEVRANVAAGRQTIDYEYDLGSLELTQGRYPLEVRVLATGANATTAEGRVLITDPDVEPLPVAIVIRATGVPGMTANGKLAVDPAEDTSLRDDLAVVTQIALDRRKPLALAIPPVLLEQFGRVAAGYETTAGVAVPATEDTPARTARMLEALRSTLATGTIDLIDVPYALPDLARLGGIGADSDLGLHWSRTDATQASVLHSPARSNMAYLGATLTGPALSSLESRDVPCVLAPPSAVMSGEATATPGYYDLAGSNERVLVIDEQASRGAHKGSAEFYDALFKRLGDGPAVIMLDIGSDGADGTRAVSDALDWVQEASWLRLVSVGSLAGRTPKKEVRLAASRAQGDSGYWTLVGKGRDAAVAYNAAAGEQDADSVAVLRAALIAESSLFDLTGARDAAYDGTSFAQEALDFVTAQFKLVRLDTKNVTLSGTKGNVPLTLVNDTGKTLNLTVRARSSTVLPGAPAQQVIAGPTQNFLTIPIDLGNTLGDTLRVEVLAGDMKITETTVQVRASYMDRLAIVLMVILVLGGLLLYIRRRASAHDAATIVADAKHRPDPPGGE